MAYRYLNIPWLSIFESLNTSGYDMVAMLLDDLTFYGTHLVVKIA